MLKVKRVEAEFDRRLSSTSKSDELPSRFEGGGVTRGETTRPTPYDQRRNGVASRKVGLIVIIRLALLYERERENKNKNRGFIASN